MRSRSLFLAFALLAASACPNFAVGGSSSLPAATTDKSTVAQTQPPCNPDYDQYCQRS